MTAILIEDLKKYFGKVHALDGLSLSVAEGTVFGFLGPNGAGKTTTIRLLTGLSKPTSGKAWVAGVEVKPGPKLAKHIGYLPEEPAFYTWMTPREFLDHVGRLFGFSAEQRKKRVGELLEQVGLAKVGKRRIGGFSKGMRQRLGLAQAMFNQPEVLFLDEPVSALDPVGRKEILEMIETLRGKRTVFMSTHILADVERICDSIGIIDQGKLIVEAPQDELMRKYTIPAFEIEVEPSGGKDLQTWTKKLTQNEWVTSTKIEGDKIRITVNDIETARISLVNMLPESKLPIRKFEMVTPSLEDVFMKVVHQQGGAK
jgi:ABC-2 type transport system ATP-binding protein